MLKLYHNDMSVCAQKVRVALAELGLEWESRHLKLRGDEQLRPEYLRINPKGQVPALVDGDIVIVESTVINEYLADAYEGGFLLPETASARAKMRWWTRQLDDDVHTSIGVISQSIAFMHQYLENTPEELKHILKSIPEEARREIKRKVFATGLENPDLPIAVRRIDHLFDDLEAALMAQDWLAGDRFSLADLGLFPYVLRIKHLNQPYMFDDRPNLVVWLEKLEARPSFAEGIGGWLNENYLSLMEKTGAEARSLIVQMRNSPQ